ncbi:YheC/YheD family protein [Paenibacillus xerothermodurans]|uniref:YheC/YheD family protein n=1 Tax=Paenibacillus xerothermodurans TaxID=1977292 RepID=A0A2W1NPN6_PAEXE|nr:YheC/YheD family protein [Paenibacillus xerothermodurans]PZE21455.1 YheC/YheD family protein [Paenibacillus xerothermodurans]
MKSTKVKIKIQKTSDQADEWVIKLSSVLVKKWKVPTQTSLQLCFGSAKYAVKVVPVTAAGVLRINDSIASRWGLSHGAPLCLQYRPASRSLHIGPLIGVLVSRIYKDLPDKPFGVTTAFCRELVHACSVYGSAVYFFTPDELAGYEDTVIGWQYTDRWENHAFPIPDVIYNRLTTRKLENLDNVQQFLRHAKTQHQTLLFNERYLNKTEVFDALQKQNGLRPYLPESHLVKNTQTIKTMCSKHPTVFVKPVTGSLGKGIIRINRQPGGGYICHFTSVGGVRKQSFSNVSNMITALSGKMKKQQYQIQQGVSLISVDGRPVDFRALVQRDIDGRWAITSIVARIAGNEHFVSNLARGGSLSTVKDALARANSLTGAADEEKLRRAALLIAKGIEAQIPGHFAELGVDLALDTHGRVWLIEVNSKPSKDDNTALSAERKMRPSVKRLVQYCRYAAKFL